MDDAEDLAKFLRREYGVPSKKIRELWEKSEHNVKEYFKSLVDEKNKIENEQPETPLIDQEKDIDPTPNQQELNYKEIDDIEEKTYTDTGFIDVLKYLAHLWRSKDRVRVLAKRFDVDPDLYAAAGLGRIPDNPTDQDIWDTMDMSDHGKLPFYDSVWQPFYIESLERLKDLPEDVKEEIMTILQKESENKKTVTYPTDTENPYVDDSQTFEELMTSQEIVLENKIIKKGTKIILYS